MKTSAKIEVQLLVEAAKKIGVKHVVISPGSRNAPLSIAFDEDEAFEVLVLVDERSAAFYALGIALATQLPVLITCTSGSAPLNYYPAIAEAFYQQIPLIVVSADRPEAWTDQGDGQTIRQQNVFQNHCLSFAQLSPIHSEDDRWVFERKLSETLQAGNSSVSGPVHLNIALSEPLYEISKATEKLQHWIQKGKVEKTIAEETSKHFSSFWEKAEKPMIVIGQASYSSEQQTLLNQLAKNGVCILTEHTSNCFIENAVKNLDVCLNEINETNQEMYFPDLIIDLGGAVISKKIKRFLRTSNAKTIRFSEGMEFMDTYKNLCLTISLSNEKALRLLAEKNVSIEKKIFAKKWNDLQLKTRNKHQLKINELPFSDITIVAALHEENTSFQHLHVSNSSMIRYVLLMNQAENLRYYCNRGTSGIDGSTSTALGFALATPKDKTVFLTGDLSFFYDSNALWNANLPQNCMIVLVNNGGGDIFNIIPGPSSTNQHEKIFTTKHTQNAEFIAKAFNCEYENVSNLEDFKKVFKKSVASNSLSIIEVNTMNVKNSEILKKYFS